MAERQPRGSWATKLVLLALWTVTLLKLFGRVEWSWWVILGIAAFYVVLQVVLWLVFDVGVFKRGEVPEGKIRSYVRPESYDLFVSYRSLDVGLVRPIVENLMASGIRVWFAEYQILLQDRERFEAAVHEGIQRSRWGLLFTSNTYAESPHCCDELEQLLHRLGADRLVNVELSQADLLHPPFKSIGTSPTCVGATTNEILLFVHRETGLKVVEPLPRLPNATARVFEGTCEGRPFRLDTTGWRRTEGEVPEFQYGGSDPLFVNLVCGAEYSDAGRQRRYQGMDDREVYDLLLEHADRHMSRLETDAIAVHLFFHKGLTHPAFTYNNQGVWTRKYSVIIPNSRSGDSAEFVFTFGSIPFLDRFWLHSAIMDTFVGSLEWM